MDKNNQNTMVQLLRDRLQEMKILQQLNQNKENKIPKELKKRVKMT